jgi:hypothetical protein
LLLHSSKGRGERRGVINVGAKLGGSFKSTRYTPGLMMGNLRRLRVVPGTGDVSAFSTLIRFYQSVSAETFWGYFLNYGLRDQTETKNKDKNYIRQIRA